MGGRFNLHIYTWPAMTGAPAGKLRQSFHETAEAAAAHLTDQEEPYAYAALYGPDGEPCDWSTGRPLPVTAGGRTLPEGRRAHLRYGTNGDHPAYLSLMLDWEWLVAEVRTVQAATKEGTVNIARRLLAERHPEIQGAETNLGWVAAG
jgi:hypothetical protein